MSRGRCSQRGAEGDGAEGGTQGIGEEGGELIGRGYIRPGFFRRCKTASRRVLKGLPQQGPFPPPSHLGQVSQLRPVQQAPS